MNCPLINEESTGLLLDYTPGNPVLDQHIGGCVRCADFVAQQAAVWAALDAWKPEPVSQEFNRRVWQRLDAAQQARWYSRFADAIRDGLWKPVVPLAAAALLIGAAFLGDHSPSKMSPAGVTITVHDADQIEQSLDDIQLLHQFDTALTADKKSTTEKKEL